LPWFSSLATCFAEDAAMQIVIALFSGLIFGLGLMLSGMTNPAKVIGFLDLAGAWDPSLALVMGAAVAVGFPAFRLAARRKRSSTGAPWHIPANRTIDLPLILGALMFGAGWALAGFCPGPALASLLTGGSKALIFVLVTLAGMAVFELHGRYLRRLKKGSAR
jgi:uncharacterized protein